MATVLVVDDRPVNRELVCTLLGYYGHNTLEADDGAVALKVIRSERPDVLMPTMDGYELVREIRSDPTTSSIPVIFYTANYLEEEARPIAEALGVPWVVTKSGDLSALLHAVHAALTEPLPASTPLSGNDFSREHLRLLNEKLMEKIRELEEKERLNQLVDAAVAVSGDLSMSTTLKRIVTAARSLVSARYAALRVMVAGDVVEFAQDGELHAVTDRTASEGSLCIPIRVNDEWRGSLHLLGRRRGGDFTTSDEQLLAALATAAGSAVANAQLYDDARRREAWLAASAEITTALLAADSAEALELVVRGARKVADAKIAWIELSTDEDTATVAACDGPGADDLRGSSVVDLVHVVAAGSVMEIPLEVSGEALGALVIVNDSTGRPFSKVDVAMATNFAAHAALALEFGRAAADRRRLTVVEERERIARDLHDMVIQRLFAIGLRLDTFKPKLSEVDAEGLDRAIGALNETMDEVRNTIFSLRATTGDASLRLGLLNVVSEAVFPLGLVPHLQMIGPIDTAVSVAIHPDVLATVREALSNAARHSGASSVEVVVAVGDGELLVEVVDDGRGLPDERHESGLANLRHRASALGGSMHTSSPDESRGLTLTWRVPTNPRLTTMTDPEGGR